MTQIGADYNQLNQDFILSRTRNLQSGQTSRYSQNNAISYPKQEQVDTYVSTRGNECSDGKDDGKIGLLSKIGNTIEGGFKCVGNMVKGAIKHPFKTALTIGACCIPVVGPVIAGGLATYGVVKGISTVATGIQIANSATTDAQAKDAWEAVGEGVVVTTASAAALKGSAGQLKTQLKGGSNTVNALKNAKTQGASAGDLAKIAVEEGFKETASNAAGVAQSAINKGTKAINKGKQYLESAKNGTLKQTVADDVSQLAQVAGDKAKATVDKASEKINETKAKYSKEARAQAKADIKQNVSDIKSQAQLDGAQVTETVKGFEAKYQDGTIMKYDSKGNLVQEISADGSKITNFNKQGDITKEVQKIGDSTYERSYKYDSKGNITQESASTKTGLKNEASSNVNNNTGVKTVNHKTPVEINGEKVLSETGINSPQGFNGTRRVQVQKTVAGKTITMNETHYYQNGQLLENPTVYQKAQIQAQTTNAGIYANKVMDYQIPGLGDNTNAILQTAGTIAIENE